VRVKAVQHKVCGTWLLQHTDTGAAERIFWIRSVENPEELPLCPGCAQPLELAHRNHELLTIDQIASGEAPPPANDEIAALQEKLRNLQAHANALRGAAEDLARAAA